MTGSIQIEVLNKNAVMVAARLKDVTDYEKQILVMSLAQSLGLTPTDIFLTCTMYPDFLADIKTAKTDLSNKRSIPDL